MFGGRLLAWLPGLKAGYTADLWFILHCLETYIEALKGKVGSGNTLGQALLGLCCAVGSSVCDSLGVRAWQDMAASTADFRHHLTSLSLPNTPSIPFLVTKAQLSAGRYLYLAGTYLCFQTVRLQGGSYPHAVPTQQAAFPESPPVPLQEASSATWLECSSLPS